MDLRSGLQKLMSERARLLVFNNSRYIWHSKAVAAHSNLLQPPRKWLTVLPGRAWESLIRICQPSLAAAGSAFQIFHKWCLGHNSYWSLASKGSQEVGSPGFPPRMRDKAKPQKTSWHRIAPCACAHMATERLKISTKCPNDKPEFVYYVFKYVSRLRSCVIRYDPVTIIRFCWVGVESLI